MARNVTDFVMFDDRMEGKRWRDDSPIHPGMKLQHDAQGEPMYSWDYEAAKARLFVDGVQCLT